MRAVDRHNDVKVVRGALRREFACAFGFLAIAFNLIAMLLLASHPIQAGVDRLAPFGDRQVICSGGGMITVDGDGVPVEDQPGYPQHRLCLYCLPLMGGHVLPSPPSPVPQEADNDFFVIGHTLHRDAAILAHTVQCQRARGPPLAVG